MGRLEILPVTGIGDVTPGTDLAEVITAAAPWLADGDVLVVTSKIVSKAEGRLVEVPPDGPERDAARDALLTAETARVVARRGKTRIVQTHHGLVMASAGIDASNVDHDHLVLLPVDPDDSARRLRAALRDRYRLDVAVVITDTMGRPWRIGLTDVAIGVAGLEPMRDYRGETDAYGNELHITQTAVVDELAAAAELVKGKYDQVPVAVVRGLGVTGQPDGPGAAALVRGADQDLFSLGTAEATALGRREAALLETVDRFGTEPVPSGAVARAVAGVAGVLASGTRLLPVADPVVRDKLAALVPRVPAGTQDVVLCLADPATGAATVGLLTLGTEIHRLRCALAAEGLASVWVPVDRSMIGEVVPLPAEAVPVALVAVGTADLS
ncbi:MAG TPA: coenzyme F420-0:L-glutamate ligase [Micromonosporaceae bacterium]